MRQAYEESGNIRNYHDARRIAELERKLSTRVPVVAAILFGVGVGILSALTGAGVMFLFRG